MLVTALLSINHTLQTVRWHLTTVSGVPVRFDINAYSFITEKMNKPVAGYQAVQSRIASFSPLSVVAISWESHNPSLLANYGLPSR